MKRILIVVISLIFVILSFTINWSFNPVNVSKPLETIEDKTFTSEVGEATVSNLVAEGNSLFTNEKSKQEQQLEIQSEQLIGKNEQVLPKKNDNNKKQTSPNKAQVPDQVTEGSGTEQDEQAIESQNIISISGEDNENPYFMTTIINGETVSSTSYYFAIYYKDNEYKRKETTIFVNGEIQAEFNGEILLKDGLNELIVNVYYEGEEPFIVTKTYNIIVDQINPIIQTNLKDQVVHQETLNWYASAQQAGKTIPLEVTIDDKSIKNSTTSTYSTKLTEGENKITLTANGYQKTFTIVYKKVVADLTIETNLKAQSRVNEQHFQFNYNVKYKQQPIPFEVFVNNKLVTPTDTNYSVELIEGNNYITVKIPVGKQVYKQQYIIYYDNPSAIKEEVIDPLAPTFTTDLVSGVTVLGDTKTIQVWAKDANGNRIRGKQVSVVLNGVAVPFLWDDSSKTSYKLKLKNGENKVSIKVWDSEGRIAAESYVIHAKIVSENEVIGTATISLDAKVLGLDYIIPPTKVEIRQNVPTSVLIDELLKANGIQYEAAGNLHNGFYLSSISKPNLLQNIQIPTTLKQLVENEATQVDWDNYLLDSLGEFDFTNGSGWMYSVNGDFPNYGFADSYLLDGDVVKIRYTLYYGKDIGGFEGLGGGQGGWPQTW